MATKRISLSFSPSGLGDWSAPDGEVESCVVTQEGVWVDPDSVKGLGVGADSVSEPVTVNPDGTLPVPLPSPGLSLPLPLFRTERRVLCRHEVDERVNLLSLDRNGLVVWADLSSPATVYSTGVGLYGDATPQGVTHGDYVMLLQGGSLHFLRWHRGRKEYVSLGDAFPAPAVEFALVREAVPPYSLFPSSWPSLDVEIPVLIDDKDKEETELRTRAALFLDDYGRECRSAGFFTAPFLVMTAWRLSDGTHLPVTMPVLMIPDSEAPTLAVEKRGSSAEAVAYALRIMGRACSLYMRVHGSGNPVPEGWRDEIVSLDVLVTQEVDLRPSGLGEGPLRTVTAAGFSQSVEKVEPSGVAGAPSPDIPEGNDHRHYPGYGEEFSDLDEGGEGGDGGEKGEGGDVPASDGSRVRAFPSGGLSAAEVEEAICALSEFRVIGSVPVDVLTGSTLFAPVPRSFGAGGTGARGIVPDFSLLSLMRPEGLVSTGGRVVAWGGRSVLPLPMPVRAAVPFSGSTVSEEGEPWRVTLEVEVLKEGRRCRRRISPTGVVGVSSPYCLANLSATFPRWFFYPDKDAVALWMEGRRGTAVRRWRLPLSPHPVMEGAYWFRGLTTSIPTESPLFPEFPEPGEERYAPRETVAVSSGGFPYLFPGDSRMSCGTGKVLGAVAAVRSLSSGQLGEFPLEIFTSEGVWAVGVSPSGGFRAVQPVSLHECVNPDAVVQVAAGTIFCTLSGVMMLEGTKVSGVGNDDENAPDAAGLRGCRIWHDAARHRLFVFTPGRRGAAVYLFAGGRWEVLPRFEGAYVAGTGCHSLLVDSEGNVYSGETHGTVASGGALEGGATVLPGVVPEDVSVSGGEVSGVVLETPPRWWQVTLRPLKLSFAGGRTRLLDILPRSCDTEGMGIRLWGAMRHGDWHPIAEGEGALRSLRGSGWRLWRVQFLYKAPSPDRLEAVDCRIEP